jgi:methionyl aminopeptidase
MKDLDKWKEASKIAAKALKYGASLIKPGATLLEVTELTEKKIFEMGGEPAFPVQISCDAIAAHYCAVPKDEIVFDKQLASIDVGVHVDGCIGDNATTIDLSGKNAELVKASRDALNNAIKAVKEQATLGEIGAAIHDTITKMGFAPVRNLSGHGLGEYNIHTKPSVPNYDTGDNSSIMNMAFAIEPFATDGKGVIYESGNPSIFTLTNKKPVRNRMTRQVLKQIEGYNGLPFCTRWLTDKFREGMVMFALREMTNLEMLQEHPPLVDQDKGLVSQAEHTIYVEEDKVKVLTLLND